MCPAVPRMKWDMSFPTMTRSGPGGKKGPQVDLAGSSGVLVPLKPRPDSRPLTTRQNLPGLAPDLIDPRPDSCILLCSGRFISLSRTRAIRPLPMPARTKTHKGKTAISNHQASVSTRRNLLSHTYSLASFVKAVEAIHLRYLAGFEQLHEFLQQEVMK